MRRASHGVSFEMVFGKPKSVVFGGTAALDHERNGSPVCGKNKRPSSCMRKHHPNSSILITRARINMAVIPVKTTKLNQLNPVAKAVG